MMVVWTFRIMERVPSFNEWERMHWSDRNRIKRHFYRQTLIHMRFDRMEPFTSPIRLRLTQIKLPTGKIYDEENFLDVAGKIMHDALQHVELIPDDSREFVKLPVIGETIIDRNPGLQVEVLVEE